MNAFEVFDALVEGCEATLDAAVREGSLSAHEAKSAARAAILNERLDAIDRYLRLLTRPKMINLAAADALEQSVKLATADVTSTITPPSFEGARPVPINDLYVPPRFQYVIVDDKLARLDYTQLLPRVDRMVVLGNPGAGKSTLAWKLCHDLASGQAFAAGNLLLAPLLIELRRYGATALGSAVSLRDYFVSLMSSAFSLEVREGELEHLLLAGRVLVVFDGLDELGDVARRQLVRDQMQAFVRRYPAVRVVVTSREVGYEHNPLDTDRFAVVRIDSFDRRQVRLYAKRWFALDRKSSAGAHEHNWQSFVDESESVADLRANPLMLALMCNFYRGQNYIPRNRPDVYDKCATMLFETWDKQRGIENVLPIEEHLRPALRDLAYWLYSTPELSEGAAEPMLRERATQFLATWRFGDRMRAEHAARGFLDFCRGRAWVFSETGNDVHGEPLFGFTHRTFMEFFAAEQVAQESENAEALARIIKSHVAKGEWDTLGQLAIQIASRRQLGSTDRVIAQMLASEPRSENERGSVTGFVVRLLEILVPKPATTASVTRAALYAALTAAERVRDGRGYPIVLRDLLTAGAENRDAIGEEMRRQLGDWLASDKVALWSAAVDLVYWEAVQFPPERLDAEQWWRGSLEEWRLEVGESIRARAREQEETSVVAAHHGAIAVREAVDVWGPNVLLRSRRSVLTGEVVESLLWDAVTSARAEQVSDEVLQALQGRPLPWFDRDVLLKCASVARFIASGPPPVARRNALALWLVLTAAACERDADAVREGNAPRPRVGLARDILRTADASRSPGAVALMRRWGYAQQDEARDALRRCRLPMARREILEKWMDGSVFLART